MTGTQLATLAEEINGGATIGGGKTTFTPSAALGPTIASAKPAPSKLRMMTPEIRNADKLSMQS